eukprot:NODE_1408_length_968_cov_101.405876_g1086_i0.p1 GENE.NODE_1408_length_968_cov_101.405876_g1086_i0~~NODE_1408_length_968_cov_101.405876_g1086_i0.p1  ORF type:complete len:75 (-),score=4.54 NODE_1408_length_968_cov_101.405876_g1086_i0:673-897(-)
MKFGQSILTFFSILVFNMNIFGPFHIYNLIHQCHIVGDVFRFSHHSHTFTLTNNVAVLIWLTPPLYNVHLFVLV